MKRILLVSVLKPVDDIRHYHKLALSIRKTNEYEIHIIANHSKNKSSYQNIIFHPLKIKISIAQRIKFQVHFIIKIFKIRPSVMVICAIELLPIATLLKTLLGYHIILDLQENYEANIKYQEEYSGLSKFIFLSLTKTITQVFFPFVNEFWLAEKSYKKLTEKHTSTSIILENKSLPFKKNSHEINTENKEIKMLFTGSISSYSGIEKAVKIWKVFEQYFPSTTLTIVGSCWNKELRDWLIKQARLNPKISLFVEETPIPHEAIEQQINAADLGLVTYDQKNDSINRMPTKCFEYASAQLPYLIQENTKWSIRGKDIGGAIPVNFEDLDVNRILQILNSKKSLFENTSESPFWTTEEAKLFNSKVL
jgi:glycosyltransferase involved in cell wall biosynthesis